MTTLKLFELVGTDAERPFSPFCWRTRMALAHKGLGAETIPWCFTEKAAIAPHQSEKVPVLLDGETSVADSWAIAGYLERTFPDALSLFGGPVGESLTHFFNLWADRELVPALVPYLMRDVLELLVRESEGIPFFIVEVVRSLAETSGRLEQIADAVLPTRVMSGGMQRVIRRRLSRTESDEARTGDSALPGMRRRKRWWRPCAMNAAARRSALR